MTAPRLEIDLAKIQYNARVLVERLALRGISVSGVTKATLGAPCVAHALLNAGVAGLADSRIENIETMRAAGLDGSITLLRAPMASQTARVVHGADVSLNTELVIIRALSKAAVSAGRTHGIVLMVELGDLREGIMPADLERIATQVLALPNLRLEGIGTNLACRCGVVPDARNMGELSALATALEAALGIDLATISGGNSSNLDWALGDTDTGRINNLRLGESILLGCEPLYRRSIPGLHTDAFTLVAEVIESKRKPSRPWGRIAETAFGPMAPVPESGPLAQAILALGHLDTDPNGLTPLAALRILGASSDHLVIETGANVLDVGTEVAMRPDYSALIRAVASPFVAKVQTQSGARLDAAAPSVFPPMLLPLGKTAAQTSNSGSTAKVWHKALSGTL